MAALKGGAALAAALTRAAQKVQNAQTLRVGFLESSKYPDGTNVAQVAFWNEYGTKTAPPRPFFRTMIRAGESTWGDQLGKILPAVDYDVDRALALMGERMSDDLGRSIIDTNAPPLSPITVMIRKIKQGRTDAPTTLDDVREAARRVAAGESTDGVNDKPLIYTNVLHTSVAYDLEGTA